MKTTSAEYGQSMNNFLSYCGLADARTISASEKDLPVNESYFAQWKMSSAQ